MPVQPQELFSSPNLLAAHYGRFDVAGNPPDGRILLTGHSHQAWPDCARQGQIRAFDDAARLVDEKWDRAFQVAKDVEQGFARLLDDPAPSYALGANTHELVVRFLSALELQSRPRLVTTDGEFHSIRRQLDRLQEEGIEVVRLPAEDPETLAERLAAAVDDHTAAVLVSAVLFKSGRIVPGLDRVWEAAQKHGAELLVDVYHALNALPFSVRESGLEGAFVVGGGYKYCQLGEGNCFLRVPQGCRLRPVITGWFAEFEVLSQPPSGQVAYGSGAARFAGATYDPTSHYRAQEVFKFFAEQGLTPEVLRQVSQHQVEILAHGFDALDLDPSRISRNRQVPLEAIGGFLVLTSPEAERISTELRHRGVATDFRGQHLRFGPAPYLSDQQLHTAITCLGEIVRA